MPHRDPDAFRVRRYMAIAAFVGLLLALAAGFGLLLIGGEHMPQKLLQGSALLGPIIAALTAIVWRYFGEVTKHDIAEMNRHRPPEV